MTVNCQSPFPFARRTGTGPLGGAGTNTGGGTTTSSTGTGSGIGAAASQLGADLAAGAHKAAQAVGLEEKPTSTKLKVRGHSHGYYSGTRTVRLTDSTARTSS